MEGRTLLVVLFVLVAGCGGASSNPDTTAVTTTTLASTTENTQTKTTQATTERTRTTQRTTVATTEAPPENPWRSEVVYVGVDITADVNDRRLYIDAVENATNYWNDAYDEYSVFEDIHFTVSANISNPDVQVDIVDDLAYCGGVVDETYVGCADIYKEGDVETETSNVEIESGYTPASTNKTVRHEFGHMLGIEHGGDPMPLMAETGDTVQQEATDAINRSYPWTKQNLTVAVTGSPTDQQRQQIQEALAYIEDGADGLLTETKPAFSMTDNETAADIVIEASNNDHACGQEYDGGSCADRWGYDDDVDDALEYYSRLEITLAGTRSDTTAWHVGYWLAVGFGATEDEIPEPLDGENDDRDGTWWE